MLRDTLAWLRCPFCGTNLSIVNNNALEATETEVNFGVLGCECCAFPIVDGIPVLIANDASREAIRALETGTRDAARNILLNLDENGAAELSKQLSNSPTTFRELLPLLNQDAETEYFLYRFSDPTYRVSAATVQAVLAQHEDNARILDLCGGSGHLTHTLMKCRPSHQTVLVDLHFWKLWLASRIVARRAVPVCCDANNPLPFIDGLFSTVLLSDAFPYIWNKRLCAGEMIRIASADGIIVMPHLHNARGENISAGDTLTAEAYSGLFKSKYPKLFDDTHLFNDLLAHRHVDLTKHLSPSEIGTTSSLTLIASQQRIHFEHIGVPFASSLDSELVINPLYHVDYQDGRSSLTRQFPNEHYELEYSESKHYLPDRIIVDGDLRGRINPASVGEHLKQLLWQCVLIDVPRNYC